MENNGIVKLLIHEGFDPEELKRTHTSKASNLKMRKDKTTSSLSESKEFVIDIGKSFDLAEPKKAHADEFWQHRDFDPKEVEKAQTSKATNLKMRKDKTASSLSESKEFIIDIGKSFDPEEPKKAHVDEASNLKMRKDKTTSSLSESKEFVIDIGKSFDPEEPEKAHVDEARNLKTELIGEVTTASSGSESVKEIKYCIYKVPRDLRKINKEAYTPQVVSIGPLHHRKEKYLIEMENQKSRYVRKFIERVGMATLEEFKSYIRVYEGKIRACYAQNLDFQSHDFIIMILRDVVFIFELFLMNDRAEMRSEFDILLDTPVRKAAIKLDLQLLENQLPYFVLKKLFLMLGEWARPSGRQHFPDPFLILASRFFYDSDQAQLRDSEYDFQHFTDSKRDFQHFTDLRRCFLLKEFCPPKSKVKRIRDLRCASKLHASGVKFESSSERRSSLEIRCEYKKRPQQMMPCIKLQELVLEIPRFEVYDETECLMRNVMAFEQLHYPEETHVCNYIQFMDSLIDTEKDVDFLVEKGIIVHGLGDNAAVANMFNKLCLQVTPSYSCYFDVGEKLKAHYSKRWNHAKATLKNVYFSDPWIATGTVAAALLLLLTLVQTVCSILQVL